MREAWDGWRDQPSERSDGACGLRDAVVRAERRRPRIGGAMAMTRSGLGDVGLTRARCGRGRTLGRDLVRFVVVVLVVGLGIAAAILPAAVHAADLLR
ncbi:hypothetical protein GCM10010171_22100 [Actinokineospora fastidiosa]|uniref:Uncharacterized protein n=1 Tax=Actinokineospora fastidiosa TaxID=1816 RepID=A0A918GCB5_9PSEU|nr:hypothetical protein GCM10010171_22100 [Actinokineospora fastidiosa]